MLIDDPLFIEYDPNRHKAYKNASLLSGNYFDYLDRALQQSTDQKNNVEVKANPLEIVKYGPASNIAGRYRDYLGGTQKDFLSAPKTWYGFTADQGSKARRTPTAKELALGWAMEATDGMIYDS